MERKGHLPRLAPEHYRGHAFVHWTLTLEDRATGWLTPEFHHTWRLLLVHTSARYELACAAYVLMPDHIHLLWLGLSEMSDQRVAIEFLRKYARPHLGRAAWQHQVYDHVLRDSERERGAFEASVHYILNNPVRAGLVAHWLDYRFTGACVPGYPDMEIRNAGHWPLFWRIYNRFAAKSPPLAHARGYLPPEP